MRRHLFLIPMTVMPGVSSMRMSASLRRSMTADIFIQSLLSSRPVRSRWESTPASMDSSLWESCILPISSEKIATLYPLIAALRATHRANAVLPMDGRAARMIRSDFCMPLVILSRSIKPVGTPMISPFLSASSLISAMLSARTSLSLAISRVLRLCAISKICCSAWSRMVEAGSSLLYPCSMMSPAVSMSRRISALSVTMAAYCPALDVDGTFAESVAT